MKVKVVLGGEAVNIPETNIGMGIAFIRVWVDGSGFTSATNSIGSLGYILLETPEVDVGTVDDARQKLFSNLHGTVVHWTVSSTLFVKDGGIANITLAIPVQQDGAVTEQKIQFVASDCTGVCVTSNALDFSCEMLQEEKKLADLEQPVVGSDAVSAVASAAPQGGGTTSAVA